MDRNAFMIIDGTLYIEGEPFVGTAEVGEYYPVARIPLSNGYVLSVVFHEGTYCDGGKTTAETAVFRPDGEFLYHVTGDQVEGHQTPAQVFATMRRIEKTYA